MKKKLVCFLILLIASFFTAGCSDNQYPKTTPEEENAKIIHETEVKLIELNGPASESRTEISGLAEYKDYIVLLPQYPSRMKFDGKPSLFKIKKERIKDYLNGKNRNPITPDRISFNDKGLEKFDRQDSGYESIVFFKCDVFITIESVTNEKTNGYLVRGTFDSTLTEISLDSASLRYIEPQADIFNLSEEAITIVNNRILTFYEANGKNVNSNPVVHQFNLELNPLQNISIPNIEYRITDATLPDSTNKFWVINYFWPGDFSDLKPAEDEIVKKFGVGKSHLKQQGVERLLEMKYAEMGINFSGRQPIILKLEDSGEGRNWEGIAKLDNLGFIIITDSYPKTLLGFVSAE